MRIAAALVAALACTAPAAPTRQSKPADFDIRIINGDVIDGTGHASHSSSTETLSEKISTSGMRLTP